ncbi:tripartite tricarboxylate transporter substrate binding protein [Pelobacter seleniigenes]|uniref:tripartite tricarboxylate transporter substrate binding protein n=1 Tax=Pelobacter seleniigenes TaxID=407188 RepID=UPI0004A729C4|nr:tripartite tricarboxylate transporter substrate binding protein [Pelobacter seleniigenes]
MCKVLNRSFCVCLTLALSCFGLVSVSTAGSYPEKPIEFIVAYSPGGGTDVGARILTKVATKYIPQPLSVLNKPGAGGEIGFTELAKAKPDGYRIGFINQPSTILLPLSRKTGYQGSDFKYIINVALDPGLLAVPSESPIKSIEDFIADAKAHPGYVTVANAGVGSDAHISIVDLSNKAGIDISPVPFKGAAGARTAALGGHVDAVVMKVGEAKTYVNSGQVRVLAVMSEERVKDFPDVPTFKEKGIDLQMAACRAVAGPKDLPDDIVNYLHDKLKQTLEDPEFIELMGKTGIAIHYMSPSELEAYSNSLIDKYSALWKQLNL